MSSSPNSDGVATVTATVTNESFNLANAVTVDLVLPSGAVRVDPVPASCEQIDETRWACRTEPSWLDAGTSGSVTVAVTYDDGLEERAELVATVTSFDNDLTNDPIPENNTASIPSSG